MDTLHAICQQVDDLIGRVGDPGLLERCGIVAKAVEDVGYEPDEKRLLGITAMSQALGQKKFEELLGGLVYKPPGKPVLVPESDKRPAMNTAINDFKENEEDNNYGKDRK